MMTDFGPNAEFAPAKINLTLHVTGQREDGYHLLQSLVVFAGVGDVVSQAPGGFAVEGPEAGDLCMDAGNLVTRAAGLFGAKGGLKLTKNLPIGGGVGGGSADAAAALRLLARQTGQPLPDMDDVLALGADVPVCLISDPCVMAGVGEDLTPLADGAIPPIHMVLVNPRRFVSTQAVFKAMDDRARPGMPPLPPRWRDLGHLSDWLGQTRNDLQDAAISVLPGIQKVLGELENAPNCRFARMSGSGATCFGLFETAVDAKTAADHLTAFHPNWWIKAAPVLPAKSPR